MDLSSLLNAKRRKISSFASFFFLHLKLFLLNSYNVIPLTAFVPLVTFLLPSHRANSTFLLILGNTLLCHYNKTCSVLQLSVFRLIIETTLIFYHFSLMPR